VCLLLRVSGFFIFYLWCFLLLFLLYRLGGGGGGGGRGAHVRLCVRGFIFVCLVIISVHPGIIMYPSNTT